MDPISFGRLWPETVARVRRHIDLLLPLAGAFLFLPQLLVIRHFADIPPDRLLKGEVAVEDQILVFLLLPVLTFAQLIIARIIGQGGTAGRTLGAELLTAFGRLPSAIGTFLIVSLVSVLVSLVPLILVFAVGGGPVHGAAVLLVVTFWLNVRFGLAVPLLANDVLGLTSALGESWRLTRGHALRVAALFGAALVGSALLSWVLGMLGAAIGVIPANGTAASEPGWGVGRWMFELVGHAASSAMFAYWFAFQAVLMGALQREAGGAT